MATEITIREPREKRKTLREEAWRRLKKNRGAMVALVVVSALLLMAIFADVLVDYETDVITPNVAIRLQGPSSEHLLGTDELGRDVLARLIYGSRISLSVGVISVILSMLAGAVLGAVAGYYGGKLEEVIMRLADVFSSIPSILMAVTIAAALGQNLFNLIVAISISNVPAFVRIVRASVLTVRDQEFIEAARAIGAGDLQIIFLHILPNCVAPVIVQATLRVSGAILATSSLSFLGLGVKAPMPEWGSMLSAGRGFLRDAWHITMFPGLAIMITILAVNMLGDGLRDALDPRLKQ